MIRTERKERLPKGYSYPLGAAALSEALGDIPQRDVMDLSFTWRDDFWAAKWRRRIAALGDVTLLCASLSPFSDRWYLRAYSVPSVFNVAARNHLLSGPLQELRRKLIAADPEATSFRAQIHFSLAEAARLASCSPARDDARARPQRIPPGRDPIRRN